MKVDAYLVHTRGGGGEFRVGGGGSCGATLKSLEGLMHERSVASSLGVVAAQYH